MTEAEWNASSDGAAMLSHLMRRHAAPSTYAGELVQPPSDRKLRLFAVALARWTHPDGYWEHVKVHDDAVYAYAESLADGLKPTKTADFAPYCSGLMWLVDETGELAARRHVQHLSGAEAKVAAEVLREVVGNPFQPVVLPKRRLSFAGQSENDRAPQPFASASYCPWLTPTVLSLAHAAYDERNADGTLDNARLAVLHDALLDAGCDHQAVLSHLTDTSVAADTDPTPWEHRERANYDVAAMQAEMKARLYGRHEARHVRGCWVIDLILSKQ